MRYIKGTDRKQITLLPDCIDDLIGQDNPVRVIDAFIDSLDLEQAGFQRATPNWTGRPPYDPGDLLKLYVYGYFNKIRSSRKLMLECSRNIELFFLLNRLTPDFRTISDFRKDNAKALKGVFRAFVKLCMKLELYQKELLAVDHTLDRGDYGASTKVILRIKRDIHKLNERMCLSEHPFGTVKWYHGAHYLLCKGKEKAAAELGLSFLAYNLKRAINLVGTRKLIEAMGV
jgi:transposase